MDVGKTVNCISQVSLDVRKVCKISAIQRRLLERSVHTNEGLLGI